jgi:hypothetical protein
MKITGSCHCGGIEYEADIDPAEVLVCHCTDCQALSGTAFRVVAFAPEHSFKLKKGRPKVYIKTTSDSGNPREQTFCPDCGAPLYSRSPARPIATAPPPAGEQAPKLGLRVGTIRERAQLKPRAQYYHRSALPWAADLFDLPRIAGSAVSQPKK